MQVRTFRLVLAGALALVTVFAYASPLEEARQRAISTFEQKPSGHIPIDPSVVKGPWNHVPFDQTPYTYTFKQIHDNWHHLMRGLRIPYPSPEWLKSRYEHFPGLMQDLGYKDRNWKMHSLNTLEVWQAFFRGDFKKARRLGIKYGGYAQVPGVFAEIIYAVYLTDTLKQKQMLLQDTIDRIDRYGSNYVYLPGQKKFADDYVMLRLGLAYAYGRLTEDAPLTQALSGGYAINTINAVTEGLAVQPNHALMLALNAAFDANVIRRVGKNIGRVALGAKPINAMALFAKAIKLQGDMAILRYEYANTLLYVNKDEATRKAIEELHKAIAVKPTFAMEALDRLYAIKRLKEVEAWQKTDMNFSEYDKRRRDYMWDTGVNLYSVLHKPFIPAGAKSAAK